MILIWYISHCTSQGSNKFCTWLWTIIAINSTTSEFAWKTLPFPPQVGSQSTSCDQAVISSGCGSVIPEGLCEGAKWSSRKQNVGSLHLSEVISTAWEGGAPGRQGQGENKQSTDNDPHSYTVNQTWLIKAFLQSHCKWWKKNRT